MVSLGRCGHCGGSLLVDDGEVKCLACGRVLCSGAVDSVGLKAEAEASVLMEWNEYVAGRRETASARYGKSSPGGIAEYKRVYYRTHREKCIADNLRWKLANLAHLREYRRGYRHRCRKARLLSSAQGHGEV